DYLNHAGVQTYAGREEELPLPDVAGVDPARAPIVGPAQQLLGGVDDVDRDAEQPAVHVGPAAREAGKRGVRARQPVGRLVDRPVAAEGDDHVVALAGGVSAQLGGVITRLRLHRLDPVHT